MATAVGLGPGVVGAGVAVGDAFGVSVGASVGAMVCVDEGVADAVAVGSSRPSTDSFVF